MKIQDELIVPKSALDVRITVPVTSGDDADAAAEDEENGVIAIEGRCNALHAELHPA